MQCYVLATLEISNMASILTLVRLSVFLVRFSMMTLGKSNENIMQRPLALARIAYAAAAASLPPTATKHVTL